MTVSLTEPDFDTAARDMERVRVALRQLKTLIETINSELSAAFDLYQLLSEKNAASGYAGLNASSRITKGADTTDDLIVDLATKGLVLKDTQATPHYWRVTVTTLGALTTADLGTTKP